MPRTARTARTAPVPEHAHVYLAHGASGGAATMQPHVDGLRRRGIAATAVQLPKRRAEEAVDVYVGQIDGGRPLVIGGHSYGGRVASLLAASAPGLPESRRLDGLVLFSYPLHRPGAPDLDTRSAHFPAIACPVLLLSGESDPFARIDLLRQAVTRLRDGELVTYPNLGHGLGRVLDDALDRVAPFVRRLG
jgi:predicted alpha/beta-hydrolase family hydrolase